MHLQSARTEKDTELISNLNYVKINHISIDFL